MSTILCPHCQEPVDIDQALAAPLEAKLREKLAGEFAKSKQESEQALKEKLWKTAQDEARKKIELEQGKAVQDLQTQLKQEQAQLKQEKERATKAEAKELELMKQQRELEVQKQQFQLELERQLSAKLRDEQDRMGKLMSETFSLKEREYQKQISDMKKLVEEATRKADTVSQQLQGEVLELELEGLLREAFPQDSIEEVKKGQLGADIIHTVRTNNGKEVGKIVWESKQTEKFSDKWLPKLREDARAVGGTVAVLMTRSLPPDIQTCGERERVWITSVEFALPLAHLLRQQLLKVDQERISQSGRDVKMEMLYRYVNSPEFRGRVEGIVESYQEMMTDLDTERRAMLKIWKKRDLQLKRMAINTAYLYGEMQGVVGSSLPEIHGLELSSGDDELSAPATAMPSPRPMQKSLLEE